jgi:hypothetical protein
MTTTMTSTLVMKAFQKQLFRTCITGLEIPLFQGFMKTGESHLWQSALGEREASNAVHLERILYCLSASSR